MTHPFAIPNKKNASINKVIHVVIPIARYPSPYPAVRSMAVFYMPSFPLRAAVIKPDRRFPTLTRDRRVPVIW